MQGWLRAAKGNQRQLTESSMISTGGIADRMPSSRPLTGLMGEFGQFANRDPVGIRMAGDFMKLAMQGPGMQQDAGGAA